MKIASSIAFPTGLRKRSRSVPAQRPREENQCTRFIDALLSCVGLRPRSPPVPESTALVGGLRDVLRQVKDARQREIRPSIAAEQACARIEGWLVDDARCDCTRSDLRSSLNVIENAYAAQEHELSQAWRNSWLSGTEEYSGSDELLVDVRSEAARMVIRSLVAVRSEILNAQRMAPYLS